MATVYLDGNAVKHDGKTLDITSVAFDGCHKIYLLRDEDIEDALAHDYKIHPIKELSNIWFGACPLRYINLWAFGYETIIDQCLFQGPLDEYDVGGKDELEKYDTRVLDIKVVEHA